MSKGININPALNAEVEGFKRVLGYLIDGNKDAENALLFVVGNYKEYPLILSWLVKNKIRGKKLVELFQNESPDGGGYHLGVTFILSRIHGHKHELKTIKIWQLK